LCLTGQLLLLNSSLPTADVQHKYLSYPLIGWVCCRTAFTLMGWKMPPRLKLLACAVIQQTAAKKTASLGKLRISLGHRCVTMHLWRQCCVLESDLVFLLCCHACSIKTSTVLFQAQDTAVICSQFCRLSAHYISYFAINLVIPVSDLTGIRATQSLALVSLGMYILDPLNAIASKKLDQKQGPISGIWAISRQLKLHILSQPSIVTTINCNNHQQRSQRMLLTNLSRC
jgi:hypothetical protein